jgi:FtsH-binding integral membrane protein
MNTTFESPYGQSVAESSAEARASFIRKTYAHLALAIFAFVVLSTGLQMSPLAGMISATMFGGSLSWLIVLGVFMGVSSLANWWANSQTSTAMQYVGLMLYVVAEAFLFLPLMYYASIRLGPSVFVTAGGLTLFLFVAISAVVLLTQKDFSFLAPILAVGGILSLGFIVVSLIFGFSLGGLFSFAMVIFAAGSILYNTSNVLHHYRPTQHVAASLTLFAGIALMFWYILRIFMGSKN